MSYRKAMGAVGPGIDISHYGAPYAQMLGLGSSGDGLGMLFRYGAGMGWTPGPGQTPGDDPRILSQYGKFQQTYKTSGPSGWGTSSNTQAAAAALLRAAQKQFPGQTVRKLGSTGWASGGRIGFEVILASPMRWGAIKAKGKLIESANPLAAVHDGLRLTDAMTQKLSGTLTTPEAAADPTAPAPPSGPEAAESSGEEGLLTTKVAGLPVWAIGIMGFGIVGGIAYLALRKKPKPKAVAANRRRRRSSRRRRRRRRSSRR
jgi:dienelactone hydrolase